MSLSCFIKTTALSVCLISASAPAALAGDLTTQEQSVCASLPACIDIVRRHDGTEFDYDVLKIEFRRWGPAGKSALFALLKNDDGHADIARMIASLGPLTPQDRQRVQSGWSQERSQAYLPLLLDGHPMSRDLLLRTLGHPDANVREQVRVALIRLPQTVRRAPVSETLRDPLLSAVSVDPVAEAATYLERLNAAGQEDQFAALLGSGQRDIVSAAYNALYRNSPAQAFNSLLTEMARIETPEQSRAIGEMLARRHKSRPDGFYLKFLRDISGDPKLSVPARASGLHGVVMIGDGGLPELMPARAEALSYLIKGQPFVAQKSYLPYLKNVEARAAMALIWEAAKKENWVNRDRVAEFYKGERAHSDIVGDLLQSGDARSFAAGLQNAKPSHDRLIRAQTNHPVNAIATAARRKLGLKPAPTPRRKCAIKIFDLDDIRAQMPFFESGWMTTQNMARVSLPRSALTTAHPSSAGWLAGYDLRKSGSRSVHTAGTILHYNNKSGAFDEIGNFTGPLAILPGQPLRLGQTTEQFWVVDRWGGASGDVSAYIVDLAGRTPRIDHIGVLPKTAQNFSIAPNGDLLIVFTKADQTPLRLTKTGRLSLACSETRSPNSARAPQ